MDSNKDKKYPKKIEGEPFGDLMKSMNNFFHQKPVRKLLDTIDDFFEQPFPMLQIPIDMYETENELVINADLPGIKRDQINIEFVGNQLIISISHAEQLKETNENRNYHFKKLSTNKSSRTISLPYSVKEKDVKASYRNGVLTIRFPKLRRKRIIIDD